jgi:hypothetical protein
MLRDKISLIPYYLQNQLIIQFQIKVRFKHEFLKVDNNCISPSVE